MTEGTERAKQDSFLLEENTGPVDQPSRGPVASPPALSLSAGSKKHTGDAGKQLLLPLEGEPDAQQEPVPEKPKARKRRKRPHGFVPVTRDPQVAKSYSENASYDNAVAQGLAQVLARLSPQELADLRARVARATSRNGKNPSSTPTPRTT